MLPSSVLTARSRVQLVERHLRASWSPAPSGAIAGRTSSPAGVLGSGPVAGTTSKRITCPVVVGVGRLEVDARHAAAERLVGSDVEQDDLGAGRHVREVDDHVGALGRAEQQLGELDRRRQEAALVADLPERQPVLELAGSGSASCSRSGGGSGSAAAPRRATGQVSPLTTIVLPKNSGFQIGATSLGPSQAGRDERDLQLDGSSPSKKARLSG